jgi:hypothetical protein
VANTDNWRLLLKLISNPLQPVPAAEANNLWPMLMPINHPL